VGKTTLASLLAACLSKLGFAIRAVDADVKQEHLLHRGLNVYLTRGRAEVLFYGSARRFLPAEAVSYCVLEVTASEMAQNGAAVTLAIEDMWAATSSSEESDRATRIVDTPAGSITEIISDFRDSQAWLTGRPIPRFVLPIMPDKDAFLETIGTIRQLIELRSSLPPELAGELKVFVVVNRLRDLRRNVTNYMALSDSTAGATFFALLAQNGDWIKTVDMPDLVSPLCVAILQHHIDPLTAISMAMAGQLEAAIGHQLTADLIARDLGGLVAATTTFIDDASATGLIPPGGHLAALIAKSVVGVRPLLNRTRLTQQIWED
jgi:hypothetical protein